MMFVPRHTRWLRMPGKARSPEPVWVSPRDVKPDEPGVIRMHWTAATFLLHDWVHDPELFRHLEAMFVHLGGELDPTPCTQGDQVAPLERAFEQERLWLWHVPPFAVSQPAVFPVEPIRPAPATTLAWIEVVLVDEQGAPVPGERCEVGLPDGSSRNARLDARGFLRLDDIPSGVCLVGFPDIDAREWGIPRPRGASVESAELSHETRQGETLDRIARQYRLRARATLAQLPSNRELMALRSSADVLQPGDVVQVPVWTDAYEPASTSSRHRYVTVQLPVERLRVRLLDGGGEPLQGAPFEFRARGATKAGTTDADGVVDVDIPFDTREVELEAGDRVWTLRVGHLDPVADEDSDAFLSGALQQLRNLAHGLDDQTLSLRERTKAALNSYRANLQVDQLTAALRRALRDDHRS
jgi:hypothetical protein